MQIVLRSRPSPLLAEGSGAPESIPSQAAEFGILHQLLSGCLTLLLCRSALGLSRQLLDLARPMPWTTDVSHPLAVPRLGCCKIFGASHGAAPKSQYSKASGSKGTRVLELLSTGGIRAGKVAILHIVKGTLFSKGMEVNWHGNAPGFVLLWAGCFLGIWGHFCYSSLLGKVVGYSQSHSHYQFSPLTQAVWLDVRPHSHLLVPSVRVGDNSATHRPPHEAGNLSLRTGTSFLRASAPGCRSCMG